MQAVRACHTHNVICILRNCHPALPIEIVKGHLSHFMKILQTWGWRADYRAEILASEINGYKKQVQRYKLGKKPLYQSRDWNWQERERKRRKKRGKIGIRLSTALAKQFLTTT